MKRPEIDKFEQLLEERNRRVREKEPFYTWLEGHQTHCFYHPETRLRKTRNLPGIVSGRFRAEYSCKNCKKSYPLPVSKREQLIRIKRSSKVKYASLEAD